MKKLIIAEKPSVSKELAKTLGRCTKTKEYYENENYIITSLFGHLLELYDMKDYNEKYKVWNLDDIPFFPNGFKWKLKSQSGIKERYNIIQNLILRNDVDVIINCGDNDREGEVLVNNIIYDIFQKKKTKKTVKRILLPDLAEITIKQELKNLRDIKNTENWYKEGLARTYIDWLYGINFSRFVSLKAKDKFVVGRVIVPTVKFIYDREMERKNFKEKIYLQIQGVIEKDGKKIKVDIGNKEELQDGKETEQKNKLNKIIESISQKDIIVSNIEEKEVIKKPKKLFSLKTLQNYMFNKYKIGLNNTLNYAQSLYEKTYTTYPRVNSEFLTNEELNKVEDIINTILKREQLNIAMKNDKRIFDSSKVESHSAIIITRNNVDKSKLTDEEIKVYDTIKNRFLANFCNEDCIVKEQTIKIKTSVENYEGKIKGTSIKQKGYLQFENDLSEQEIPTFKEGEILNIDLKIVERKSTPPEKVTEAELNNFYENPFKKESTEESTDDDYVAILKGAEIGTPATRASIIEKVKQDGYIVSKKNALEITEKGIKLIEVLNKLGINLFKEKTVEVGIDLKKIYNGEKNVTAILEKVENDIKQGINKEIEIEEYKRKAIAQCPICNNNIYENENSFRCENWKECGFSIWKKICGKKLTQSNLMELLKKGYTKKLKGFTSKSGKKFEAALILEDNKVKLKFD